MKLQNKRLQSEVEGKYSLRQICFHQQNRTHETGDRKLGTRETDNLSKNAHPCISKSTNCNEKRIIKKEEMKTDVDLRKRLLGSDRVSDEVANLRLENKNMRSNNNYLQIQLKKLDTSQTELLQRLLNIEKNNNKLHEEVRRLSIQNKILNSLVRRQCSEKNYKNEDRYTLQANLDKYHTNILPDIVPANKDIENKHASLGNKSAIGEVSKRLLLNIPTTHIVAFSVALDHEETLGPLQVVKYNKILTNVGNMYDQRHGQANIPIKGIYLLAVTCMNHADEQMHIELVRNDDLQGSVFLPPGQSYDSMSQTLVLSLEKNDLVWVRVYNNNFYVGHHLYGTSKEFYNTFVYVAYLCRLVSGSLKYARISF